MVRFKKMPTEPEHFGCLEVADLANMGKNLQEQVETHILSIVLREFRGGMDQTTEFKADTPLLGKGLGLDSLEVLRLVTQIEAEFGIEVQDEELTVGLFSTVGSLAEHVRGKLSADNGRGSELER
jgi:acyl carrier protein